MTDTHVSKTGDDGLEGHRRQASEPPHDWPQTTNPTPGGEQRCAAATSTLASSGGLVGDRRLFMERGWSTSDIQQRPAYAGLTNMVSRTSMQVGYNAPLDMAQFLQQSWATPTDFLGAFSTNTPTSPNATFVPYEGVISTAVPSKHLPHLPLVSSSSTGSSRRQSTCSSAIHDAARITDWDGVYELCQSHPEWASYAGRDRWTALHHACNRRCPHAYVVEALIDACPEALTIEEEKGWLPLHYACRFKAPKSVVKLLLSHHKLGAGTESKKDKLGRTPLYYALRYDAPPGVVGLLLHADPSVVLEQDKNDDSPLALVWNSWADKLEGKRIVHSFLPGGFPEPENTSVQQRAALLRERLQRETKLKKRWDKVNMLLKAAFGFPVEEDEDDEATPSEKAESDVVSEADDKRVWRIVHATAAVKCHLSLFLLACALHPEQVSELDQHDLRFRAGKNQGITNQTALHLAASSNATGEPGKAVIITLLSLYRDAAQVIDSSGSLPLHRIVENPHKNDWPMFVGILYHFYPRAVQMADQAGRLPLHRAAAAIRKFEKHHVDDGEGEEGHEGEEEAAESVILHLLRAYPQAASRLDGSNNLPLHHAVMHGRHWDDDVQAIYNVNRNAVQTRNAAGRLPLHLAAASPAADPSLIQKLLQLHPRAASMPDRENRLALHAACAIGKDGESVRLLYEAYPAALRQAVNHWLPLHISCAAGSTLTSLLIEWYPEAARVHDANGRYPLHLACAAGCTKTDLHALIQSHSIATSTPDNFGLLPFHVAALQEEPPADLELLYELLRADPTILKA